MNTQSSPTLLFVSLAMNQTVFFKAVGDEMEKRGFGVAYASFHERSHEWLTAQGAHSYNPFALQPDDPDAVELDRFDVRNANLLLNHEKAAYEVFDSARLLRKFKGHLHAMAAILDEIAVRNGPGPVYLVQELGGFLSVLAAYHAARARGIDNLFIEPSFFRGRVFFERNSFAAPAVPGPLSASASEAVRAVLDQVKAARQTVIPAKDRLHYRGASSKLLDSRNMRRLVQKLADRYLLGKREEFQYAGGHVRRHLRMFFNHLRLKSRYRPLPEEGRLIYYPLHVPADFALAIRSPEFLDQYALIDYLCRSAPIGFKVAVKEHPALIGAISPARMGDLLARNDNLLLLDPGYNNYEVLGRAEAVVTVNSKSGAEALLLGKPVVVLGDAFYRPCGLVYAVDRLGDLPAVLAALASRREGLDAGKVEAYFQDVWNRSFPGELYDMAPDNIQRFAESLMQSLVQD